MAERFAAKAGLRRFMQGELHREILASLRGRPRVDDDRHGGPFLR
jgi:hypothetical protein